MVGETDAFNYLQITTFGKRERENRQKKRQ